MRLIYLVSVFLATTARCQEQREALFSDVNEFTITYSDDDIGISLPSFLLAIFPIYRTDRSLPDDAITQVGGAMDNFVLARLNALYSPVHKIKDIRTRISNLAYDEYDEELRRLGIKELTREERIGWEMAHGAADTPNDERKLLRGLRRLDILPGNVMEMTVNVTFDQQPAPSEVDVAEALKKVMQDLSDYVADLRAANDGDLSGVKYCFRREILPPTAPPTNTPTVAPTLPPTAFPSSYPTPSPTSAPTDWPTASPTVSPTLSPTIFPTGWPTASPTVSPTESPTSFPTGWPTGTTLEPSVTSDCSECDQEGYFCSLPEGNCADGGNGNCIPKPKICTLDYTPVCGCDGVTYGNACSAAAKGVSVEFQGECTTVEPTFTPSVTPTEGIAGGSDGEEPAPTTATTPSVGVPSSSPPTQGSSGGSGGPPTEGGGVSEPNTPSATDPTVDAPSSGPTEGSGKPTTPSVTDPTLGVPSSSPPTEGSAGGEPSTPSSNAPTDSGSTNNATDWGDDGSEPDEIGGSKGTQNSNDESNTTVLVASLVVAGAAVVVITGLFAYRRHRHHLNESRNGEFLGVESDLNSVDPSMMTPDSKALGVESDLESSGPSSTTPSSQFTINTENVDSVFAGLDSPYLKKTKSLSSATTVQANNFHGPTPRSTTNASVSLFAFSEDESLDESVEIVPINLSEIASNSNHYSPMNKEPATATMQEHLFIATNDEYLTASPLTSPASYSKLMDTGDEDWKPPTSDPNGALIAVGVIGAATTAAAVAMARRRSDESDEDGSFPQADDTDADISRRYHAAYQGEGDGTMVYQTAAAGHMPDTSDDDSTGSHQNNGLVCGSPALFQNGERKAPPTPTSGVSSLSGSVHTNSSKDTDSSQFSSSRQLINDLVWLEKKIADVRSSAVNTPRTIKPGDVTIDSLSTISNFPNQASSPSSNDAIQGELVKQSIVCRDVQVPPGKLNVVIHSTKDGPAIYSVHEGSALVDKVFPGDLITAVDSVNTRNLSAEQVLHMMIEKNDVERKMTVLHCE